MNGFSTSYNLKKSLAIAIASSLSFSCAYAAEEEGSLNEMWKDKSILDKSNSAKPLDTGTDFKIEMPSASAHDKSTATESKDNVKESTEDTEKSAIESDSSAKAPSAKAEKEEEKEKTEEAKKEQVIKYLCTLDELKESVLVKSGGWPGVGPFKASDDSTNTFLDDNDNKIELKASGNKVDQAELKLANFKGEPSDLLTLQMTTDFFLEALGAKGGKIARFNSIFEEKQNDLTNEKEAKLTLNAGKLEVSIAKTGTESNKSDVLISVVSTELVDKEEPKVETKTIEEPSIEPDKKIDNETKTEPKKPEATDLSAKKPDPPVNVNSGTEKGSILDKPVSYHLKNYEKKLATKPQDLKVAESNQPDPLKQRFSKLIENWQAVKRRAVKNRQKQNLFKILGGKALSRQSQAIKWLLDNHRYYEMTPISMNLERYKELTPKKKYEVVAKISERRKFIDANKMRILKDTTTTYTVSYIVENIRGQWLIIDSKVLK